MENENEKDVALTDAEITSTEATENQETVEFDPAAFMSEEVANNVATENTTENTTETTEESNSNSETTDEDYLEWNIGGEFIEDTSTTEDTETVEATEETSTTTVDNNNIISQFKDIGIEANSTEELLEKVKQTLDDKINLETKYVTNDKIDYWKKALSLNDKSLVKKELEAKGFNGEELDTALQTLESNGTINIKAKEIRYAIRNSIDQEISYEKQKAQDAEARQMQAQNESRQKLKEHLDNTETMFGFKMSKDNKDLPKVREGHFEYINSGQFLKDALKDPETITEVAWFVKNKDVIINALQNRGKQTAKKELLNDIGAHSTSDSNNFYAQSDDDNQEFDPKKFIE